MSQKLLIDACLPGETRVVVTDGKHIEDFDYEQSNRVPIKGNIYLAKVTRVEPSLQAAFVDYGSNRHGFLSFSDIHPDYFRIPVGDIRHEEDEYDAPDDDDYDDGDDENDVLQDEEAQEDIAREARRRHNKLKRTYKIQEVIKRGQVILVQAVKEERGNKGAAMTSYISLAGRYCVLMPNTDRGSGISRKISDGKDRGRLKETVRELDLPEGMGLIVRTAGAGQTKAEIRRDFAYLSDTWNNVRELTMESTAPSKVYDEGNLLKRAIRDLYSKEIGEIIVDGKDAYNSCREYMKSLMPSHVKKISLYKGDAPLFIEYGIEEQLTNISDTEVPLRSGGFLILNQTEALVAIDVNSGKSIRERHIEKTALATNLEAVEEIARQLKLRDMAGLIVIDLITMEERRNNKTVENHFRKHLRGDRARIQVGHISIFGLLELSRQRIRPSFLESIHERCPMCDGGGYVQTYQFMAQSLIRQLEVEGYKKGGSITVEASTDLANYLLNHKRDDLQHLKERYGLNVDILISSTIRNGFSLPDSMKKGKDKDTEEEADDRKSNNRSSNKNRRNKKRTRKNDDDYDSQRQDDSRSEEAREYKQSDSADEDFNDEKPKRNRTRRKYTKRDDSRHDDAGRDDSRYDDSGRDDSGRDDFNNDEPPISDTRNDARDDITDDIDVAEVPRKKAAAKKTSRKKATAKSAVKKTKAKSRAKKASAKKPVETVDADKDDNLDAAE